MLRSSSGGRVGRSAPRVGPQHKHAKSTLAHARWPDGQYSHGVTSARVVHRRIRVREAQPHEARANNLLRYCCARARVGGLGRSTLRIEQPQNHAKSTLAHARWATGQYFMGRKARWPRAAGCGRGRQDHRRPCCQSAPVLTRLSSGGRRGEERAPRWPTTQPRRVRTARPACSVAGRPLLHGENSVRAVRHGVRMQR